MGRERARRLRHSLVFVAVYDGDPLDYIIALSLGARGPFRATFGGCVEFPDVEPSTRLLRYIDRYVCDAIYEYSAYAGATLKDVRAALAFEPHFGALQEAQRTGDPGRFVDALWDAARVLQFGATRATVIDPAVLKRRAFMSMLRRAGDRVLESVTGHPSNTPWLRTLTSLVPIREGHERGLREDLEELRDRAATALDAVPSLHFARFAVVDRIYALDNVQALADGPYLLFSAQFNGSDRALVAQLRRAAPRVARLWEDHGEGYEHAGPGGDRLRSYLRRSYVPSGLCIAALGDRTVAEVRSALRSVERTEALVSALASADPPDPSTLLQRFRAAGAAPAAPVADDAGGPRRDAGMR